MNVYTYAVKTLDLDNPCEDDEELHNAMIDMPIDSVCGNDCKLAIDACAEFIKNIRKAYGEYSQHEIDAVISTLNVLGVFICG